MVPKGSVEVLSCVPKENKVMAYHTEKICVLDKLCSGMSYRLSAVSSM